MADGYRKDLERQTTILGAGIFKSSKPAENKRAIRKLKISHKAIDLVLTNSKTPKKMI
jgi:pyridoxal biosynthesis lyase PdxS